MDYPIVYDITRLAMRVVDATPNGIDRVDMALARYFLSQRATSGNGMLFLGPLGHRMVSRSGAVEAIDAIHSHFGEDAAPEVDVLYGRIKSWLKQGVRKTAIAPERVRNPRKHFIGKSLSWVARHGAPLCNSPGSRLPRRARYINVSQYPLAIEGAFDWRTARPDIKMIFFIHDMLPLEMPEYFRDGEFFAHQRRMINLARHGAGAIVSTHIVKDALQHHIAKLGRNDLPILVAPLPVPPIFLEEETPDGDLPAEPFFVQCGTLEPRKNHLMILQVWRELVARRGSAARKLILVGARGWKNENVIELLERNASLKDHVLEISGLATPSLKRLMMGARAVLMPSFGEGYGLPLVEALAVGTSVIASDIPVFREIAGDRFTRLSPTDGEGWLKAIELFTQNRPRPPEDPALPIGPDRFSRAIEEFVGSL